MINFDVNFLRPFIEGTINTLKIQCNSPVSPKKPFMAGQGPAVYFEIAALIGIVSSGFNGSMALCFPKAVFLHLMNGMMGENYTEITPEIQDGAGELCNIIFGQAKRSLNAQGEDIQLAIPTIVMGKEIQPLHKAKASVIVVPFQTEVGVFCIEICGEKKASASGAA